MLNLGDPQHSQFRFSFLFHRLSDTGLEKRLVADAGNAMENR